MLNHLSARYATALENEMRRVVTSGHALPDEFVTMLSYPFGWVEADGSRYEGTTGKRIRPFILLLCAEASGGDWRTALPAAAAVEILHNFSLVHDDIQDNSDKRHNRDTVWRVWGQTMAINVGDAIFALSYQALLNLSESLPDETVMGCWRVFNSAVLELTHGQYLDMQFEASSVVKADDYLRMVEGKTASLLAACTQMGGLIGTKDRLVVSSYADFGVSLGIAFQIRDDILGIWGQPEQTGKSAATDILSRKKSLPVIYGLERSVELRELYAQSNFTESDVARIIHILENTNVRIETQELEAKYHKAALDALERANPQSSAAEWLFRLVDWLFGRDR